MGNNVIVGQSGGPASVINSSLTGVYEAAHQRGAEHVYGMLHGVAGLLDRQYIARIWKCSKIYRKCDERDYSGCKCIWDQLCDDC